MRINYRNNVGCVCEMDDRFAAHVQGMKAYATNLFCDDFLLCVDDDDTYNYLGEFEAEFASVDLTMEVVVESLRKNGMSTAELIVWAYYLQRPCHCCGVGKVIDALIECPMGTNDDPNVWADAAHALERELDNYHADGSIDKEFDEEYQLGAIRNTWQRAGDEARAIPCWLKCVDSVCNWEETAELLLRNEHYDDLIAVVRRGIGKYDCDCDGIQSFCSGLPLPRINARRLRFALLSCQSFPFRPITTNDMSKDG